MIDADLAELYGVTTKRLYQQVRRNLERFPEDFMFELTVKEKAEVVANCIHLAKLKFSPVAPLAFTEHGARGADGGLRSSIRRVRSKSAYSSCAIQSGVRCVARFDDASRTEAQAHRFCLSEGEVARY